MNWKIFDFETLDFQYVTENRAMVIIYLIPFAHLRYAVYRPSMRKTVRRHSDFWTRVY